MNATKIRALRERAEMSRADLAGKLGLTYMTIYKWETGRATPPLATLVRALKILGADLHELSLRKRRRTSESR